MPDPNTLRRVNWLWKHRHKNHDDITRRITVIERREEETSTDDSTPQTIGAHLHLQRSTTQTIAVGGEAVSWTEDGPFSRLEFAPVILPATEITIPGTGYYNIAVDLEWDTWTDGGTVKIVRGDGSDLYPSTVDPGVWSSTAGKVFSGVAPAVPLNAGDVIEVIVDHDDASTHDLSSATLAVYLVDRNRAADTYRSVVLAAGPVAYWRLAEPEGDSTAVDETGNGHDGTYTAGVTQGVTGLLSFDPNLAAEFSQATTDSVDVPTHADLKFLNADFTLEAWVEVTTTLTQRRYAVAWPGGTSVVKWGLAANDSGGSIQFAGVRGDLIVALTGADFAYDTAYYVVVTYNAASDTLLVYVNGTQEASGSQSTTLTDTTTDLRIGRATEEGIAGIVDEVAIYDYPLTPDEISLHFSTGRL